LKIAIASGKGGTGKTTVAVNFAQALAAGGHEVTLLDCDVEEPNVHLFLHQEIETVAAVETTIPQVDEKKCTGCRVCAEVCEYHALAVLGNNVLVFPELCHACGACARFCPERAILEVPREIGMIQTGRTGCIRMIEGLLNVGEVMSPAVIKRVKEIGSDGNIEIIDAPPGTSCPVIAAVRDTDGVLLVTEPTPFGVHDLKLAVGMVRLLGLPCAVAINRCDVGETEIWRYCSSEHLPIVLEIPDDRRIAEAYSRGGTIMEELPEYRETFFRGWQILLKSFGMAENDSLC